MRFVPAALAAATLALAAASPAGAMPVLVLHGHQTSWHEDRVVGPVDLPPPPAPSARVTAAGHGPPRKAKRKPKPKRPPATLRALARLVTSGAIGAPVYNQDVAIYKAALRVDGKLSGTRRRELAAVIANVDRMASTSSFTPDRLAPIFLTLQRNTQWWSNGPIPAADAHVAFDGSDLIWQYYPGQGVELQVLANFGKANGYWGSGDNEGMRALLSELLPLAVNRGGATVWEYYFEFGGGKPPWTSAMSQGTAVQALGRAAARLRDPSYVQVGQSALGIFAVAPPVGVRLDEPSGPYYLLYSFDPNQLVLNGFLQTLIGLHDFAQYTGDPTANQLYQAGLPEAEAEVPLYDTGAWSLYDLSIESDLSYHKLVTGFLKTLCRYTSAPAFCQAQQHFTNYLHTAPTIAPATARIRAGAPAKLTFTLDKVSHVQVKVVGGTRTVYYASTLVYRGTRSVTWARPAKAGSYQIELTAVDLAGNRTQVTGPLTILPARHKPKRHR